MEYSSLRKKPASSSQVISAYRLVAPKWASTALSGEGARKYGGRWNSPGRAVAYLGESRALTALELLVHLTTPRSRRKSYTLLEITLPAGSVKNARGLAEDWNVSPPTKGSTQVGDLWLEESQSLALRVPSTLVREESVILLNPEHRDFSKVEIRSERKFHYDPRFE